jgi:hypothetical protein
MPEGIPFQGNMSIQQIAGAMEGDDAHSVPKQRQSCPVGEVPEGKETLRHGNAIDAFEA